jgi:general secretion pathway protein A
VYKDHYRLSREPFSASPDPDFLWLNEKHAAAFESLKKGILEREGCVLLVGDIGTGKTTLIQRLARLGGVAAALVAIHETGMTRLDFCNSLAVEFGLKRRFERREDFYTEFKNVLLGKFSAYKKVLVVIDEAQRLNPEIIGEALELAGLELAGRNPLKIIFVGQPGISELLKQEAGRGGFKAIAARCDLNPFNLQETGRYIEHRLKVAGRGAPLFTEDAVKEVHALSKGYPRLINIVCDHALLYGFGSGLNEIDGRVVTECSRDLTVALDLDVAPQTDAPAFSGMETTGAPSPAAPVRPGRSRRAFLYIAAAVAAAGLLLFAMTR